MSKISFKKHAFRNDEVDLFVDGVKVGSVRKRKEWYSNIGPRGALYTYFDVIMLDARRERKIASASTRKAAVAEALVEAGMDEAALASDPDTARYYAAKLGRTI
jgi:hypothetical protein